MRQRILAIFSLTLGLLIIAGVGVMLAIPQPVSAQCGSQASSCKNCHETQGQDPVNNDGTDWHSQHSFGDFCYLCHAGNNQAMDETAAHTGLVDPLSDIAASCQSCHPTDTMDLAQVYATTLGVQVGEGTGSSSGGSPTSSTSEPESISDNNSSPVVSSVPVNSEDLVNYVDRYNEMVLGKKPTNWGNVILIAMILMLLLGGGAFVIMNEKLVKVTFGDTKAVDKKYPADVVDMLPLLTKLKPQARKSLTKVLGNASKTKKALALIDEFSCPE